MSISETPFSSSGPVFGVPNGTTNFPAALAGLRHFSLEEYRRMGAAGVFADEDRLELIGGFIYMMSPIGKAHFKTVSVLQKRFLTLIGIAYDLVVQQPLELPDSEPVPDLMVVRGPVEHYESIPTAGDVRLLIEVADTTLPRDRLKACIYAAAGVPEYWIVNLPERRVEIHRNPVAAVGEQPAKYEAVVNFGPDQTINVILDGTPTGSILVKDILL